MEATSWEARPQSAVEDIKSIYTGALRFIFAAPLLFLIPVIGEFAQHVAEIGIGMYASEEDLVAASSSPRRLAFGFLKLVTLLLPMYYFSRFLGFSGDAAKYSDFRWVSLAPFMPVLLLYLGSSALSVLALSDDLETGWLLGVILIAMIASFPLMVYLQYWTVARALGEGSVSLVESFSTMNGHFLRALGYFLPGYLPLVILHYLLADQAIGLEGLSLWLVLILDSFLVGILALCVVGCLYFAARWAKHNQS